MQDDMDIHPRLNVLDCFSGYGGFALGLRLAYPDTNFRTVAYIEWDRYCQQVIQARIGDGYGYLDDAPLWGGDIREFDGKPWRGRVDILSASFPCQPFSTAGKREREFDSKGRNLWPDTLRIIGEVGPSLVILENVPGILVGSDGRPPYGGTVVGELAEVGYDAVWRVVSAADAGAPHLRNRWWLLAYPNRERPDSQNDYDLSSVSGMGLG